MRTTLHRSGVSHHAKRSDGFVIIGITAVMLLFVAACGFAVGRAERTVEAVCGSNYQCRATFRECMRAESSPACKRWIERHFR